MDITKEFVLKLSEERLKEAVEYYMNNYYKQNLKITHITHDVRSFTEGYGRMEMDYEEADGLTIKAVEK